MRPPYVTATEYGVSQTSGSGIAGVLLNVYKVVPREPTPDDPLRFEIEYAVKDMPFPDAETCDAYELAHGWIKPHVRKPPDA